MNKLSLLLVAGLGSTASAGAFGLNEFDARAVGRGDAESASDSSPSSIFYNVGGLAIADGIHLQLSGSIVAPFATFNHADGTKTDSNTGPQPLPAFFASARVHDMVTVGIGFTTPFGLALSWPDNSPTNDELHKQSLRTYFITPAVGLNLHKYVPGLTLGGGVDIVPATVQLDQDIYFGDVKGTATLGGTGFGIGGRAGAMYRPEALPGLSIGAMWRSAVDVKFNGTGDFDAQDPYRSQLPPDGDIKTTITMPMQILGGVAYKPIPQLELEANVIWTQWSSFKTLDIEVPAASGTGTMTISTDEEYQNTVSVRGGVDYALTDVGAAVRAGFIYDPTPIKPQYLTVRLPDIDRLAVTIGGSKTFGAYAVHLGLLYILPANRKTADDQNLPVNKGSFDVSAFVASLTLDATFGK